MRIIFVIGLLLCAVSCRTGKREAPTGASSTEPRLSPTGYSTSVVAAPRRTITLSWTNVLVGSNAIISIRHSPSLATPLSLWPTLTNLSNTNRATVPTPSGQGFFRAVVVSQPVTLAWDYPSAQLGPALSFRLYERTNSSAPWRFVTNIPSPALSTRLSPRTYSSQFAITASNSALRLESPLSNVASWTNLIGEDLPLQVQVQ